MASKKDSKVYGYARISRETQSIKRQIDNIKKLYPDAIIFQEAYTGTKTDRPEFNRLLKKVKTGDTIVFDSVSRMSRNAQEGIDLYFQLYDDDINLVFLKEEYINTETYKRAIKDKIPMTGDKVDYILTGINQYLKELAKEQIRIAFDQAQKEVDDLHERTSEGIEKARAKGKQIGQKQGAVFQVKKESPIKDAIVKYSKDFKGTNTDAEVISIINGMTFEYLNKKDEVVKKDLHVSRNTYYKYKSELKGAEQC